ncbi:hypothetical protein LZ31DRAFT_558619 [Colletotrichum somersetense]|nr:hypothetical protein LZ31DRAFT_558619 [Colletotrichum somersetense]
MFLGHTETAQSPTYLPTQPCHTIRTHTHTPGPTHRTTNRSQTNNQKTIKPALC